MHWSHLKLPWKDPSQPHFFFVYIQEFDYYILFGVYRSKENHRETTEDTYFQEHNLQ